MIRQGEQTAKTYRRTLALLELDRGKTYTEVSKTLQVTIPTLSGWAAKYLENELKVLQDQPRAGRPIEIDGKQSAKALAERFEFYFTPKSASWLNMIEIEFSALARQCLHRRIPTMAQLEHEILALVNERSSKQIKINWQFSIQSARSKLNSQYSAVLPGNKKFADS